MSGLVDYLGARGRENASRPAHTLRRGVSPNMPVWARVQTWSPTPDRGCSARRATLVVTQGLDCTNNWESNSIQAQFYNPNRFACQPASLPFRTHSKQRCRQRVHLKRRPCYTPRQSGPMIGQGRHTLSTLPKPVEARPKKKTKTSPAARRSEC